MLALVALTALVGCTGRHAPGSQRTAGEARSLAEEIDALEERLVADQARVRHWRELRGRHEEVAGIACENLARHAEANRGLQAQQRSTGDLRAAAATRRGRKSVSLARRVPSPP